MNIIKSKIVTFSVEAQRIPAAEMLKLRDDHNRLLALAMVGTYKIASKGLIPALGRHLKGEFIGAGYEQVVYSIRGQNVAKILINSIGSSAELAEEISTHKQDDFDKVKPHLDEHWVDTTFYPMALPRYLGGYAVVAVQPDLRPYKKFETVDDVVGFSAEVDYREKVGSLARKIGHAYTATGLYPDITGPGNVVLTETDTTLKIADTIAQEREKMQILAEDGRTRLEIMQDILARWLEYSQAIAESCESPAAVAYWR